VLLLCTRLAYTPLLPYTTLFRSNCTYYYNVHRGKRCFIESYWLGLWICIDIWSWCGSFCTRTSSGKSITKHDSINEGIIAGVEIILIEHKDRKSTRLNSSHVSISYADFC